MERRRNRGRKHRPNRPPPELDIPDHEETRRMVDRDLRNLERLTDNIKQLPIQRALMNPNMYRVPYHEQREAVVNDDEDENERAEAVSSFVGLHNPLQSVFAG